MILDVSKSVTRTTRLVTGLGHAIFMMKQAGLQVGVFAKEIEIRMSECEIKGLGHGAGLLPT